MVNVVGIKFRNAGKVYYFDPAGFDVSAGDNVIIETARGIEFGTVTMEQSQVHPDDIVQPLRKIIRVADENDKAKYLENEGKKEKALEICAEKIKKHGLEMKLIDVEYTFDNSKVIFYFTADGRVDFRELVKDLASVFRTRIELRQIGVRDKAKMVGGVGCCGRELCCHQWMCDFQPVSIKMAKCQNLSLNPSKISGMCGRLMCCLKFENSTYQELKKGMPDSGETVMIPEGKAIVWETDILEGKIKCRLIEEDDKSDRHEQKLSTEVYVYGKEDVKRLGRKGSRNNKKNEEEEIPEEVKELLKD
ncbi:MAG: stage 0 sporulation family protein [Eubacteriaceae bacterium]|jgi:cell fate regulator YaaT (PSP1 superfamily)|nr:stage 0 sporulation family protein [Eubacteriaceae bacterium]